METDRTVIISTWIHSISWLDGWEVMQADAELRQPSLWLIEPGQFHTRLINCDEHVLSEDEARRASRFHKSDHMLRFKAAHTALRVLLGRATHSDPRALDFGKGHHNKPSLEKPENTGIQFNLSYTENRVLIGLNPNHPIGIDIEWSHRPFAIESLLEACFSANEIAFICARKDLVHQRFFTLWTRKEAILKLTGEGIGDHLPHFEVLDGICYANKQIIGGQPPDRVYLYSFSPEEGFIGCMASSIPITPCSFYRL